MSTLSPAPKISSMPSEVAPDAAPPAGLEIIAPVRDAAAAPAWFLEKSAAAWEQFQALPVPAVKDEAWRYSNAKKIALSTYQPAPAANEQVEAEAVAASAGLAETAGRFVFVNDRLVVADTTKLPAGVVCLPFEQALQSQSALLQQHFMQRAMTLGSAKFAALHLAHVRAGLVIMVPQGVTIEQPIEVFHWIAAEHAAIFPHTLIVTEDNADITVVDHYRTCQAATGLSLAVADLVAGKGSRIRYIACQELGEKAQAMHLSSTVTARDAQVKNFQVQLGAEFSRSESVSDLLGEGSHSDMLSVALPTGEQIVDQRTLQNHKAPHATSNLLYKNALYGKSRSIFSGLITVDAGAHFTDAYQTCRNLLNSDEAEATSLPGLEINADQVKCSHGATCGPVSDEELFYLKARGISDGESRKLIVEGFLADALAKLGNGPVADMVVARIHEKMERTV